MVSGSSGNAVVTVENVLRPLALAWRFEFYKASVSVPLSLSRTLSLALWLSLILSAVWWLATVGGSLAPRQGKLTQCFSALCLLLNCPHMPAAICFPPWMCSPQMSCTISSAVLIKNAAPWAPSLEVLLRWVEVDLKICIFNAGNSNAEDSQLSLWEILPRVLRA